MEIREISCVVSEQKKDKKYALTGVGGICRLIDLKSAEIKGSRFKLTYTISFNHKLYLLIKL